MIALGAPILYHIILPRVEGLCENTTKIFFIYFGPVGEIWGYNNTMNTKHILQAYMDGVRDANARKPSRAKQYRGDAKRAYQNGYKNRI